MWNSHEDATERRHQIDRVSAELSRRGLDPEKFIRIAFAWDIAASIHAAAFLPRLIKKVAEPLPAPMRRAAVWSDVLGLSEVKLVDPKSPKALTDELVRVWQLDTMYHLIGWANQAELDDVIDWMPPEQDLDTYQPIESDDDELALWLVDRFTQTYLGAWRSSSLKLEWKYQHGKLSSVCPQADMVCRRIDENELARHLADRAVRDETRHDTVQAHTAAEYVPVALELLKAGRRREAAAVFEAVVTVTPKDAYAVNNWAFCLMVDDPNRAIELFEQAARMGLADNPMLIGNRLACLLRLNRLTTALSVATSAVELLRAMPLASAYMWNLDGFSDVVLVADLRRYVLEVIERVVDATADPAITTQWDAEIATLRTDLGLE